MVSVGVVIFMLFSVCSFLLWWFNCSFDMVGLMNRFSMNVMVNSVLIMVSVSFICDSWLVCWLVGLKNIGCLCMGWSWWVESGIVVVWVGLC